MSAYRQPATPPVDPAEPTLCPRCHSHAADTPSAWGCPGVVKKSDGLMVVLFGLVAFGGITLGISMLADAAESLATPSPEDAAAMVAMAECMADVTPCESTCVRDDKSGADYVTKTNSCTALCSYAREHHVDMAAARRALVPASSAVVVDNSPPTSGSVLAYVHDAGLTWSSTGATSITNGSTGGTIYLSGDVTGPVRFKSSHHVVRECSEFDAENGTEKHWVERP
jgi:hypothetical protein